MATPEPPFDAPARVDRLLAEAGGIDVEHLQRAQAHVHAALSENRGQAAALSERLAQGAAPINTQEPAHALLEALTTLETHASRAEASVGEITADIRWLDMAKRHVAQSIVTLRRLQMLVRSTFQLEQLCESRQFREAASALQAVQALLEYFAPYERVPYVLEQRAKMERLHERLRTMVLAEYEQAFQAPRAQPSMRDSALSDAALVVEALGADVRDALVDAYCKRQLREYRRVFRAVDEAGQLDNVARRYAWIRRLLRTWADEHASAFLPAWHVDRRLLALFSELTYEDLRSTLVREQPRLHIDMLLNALHATQEFEAQVARQYGEPWVQVVGARRLSDAFTPYLGVFVDAQDKHLAEMLAQHAPGQGGAATATAVASARTPAEPGLGDEPVRVLASSTDLVTFYRQTLERCAQLGPHAPVRELSQVYAKWLKRYATDVLLPEAQQSRDTLQLCTVLNTADYGMTTCTQLAQRVTEKLRALDGGADAPPCVLDAEKDAFVSVAAAALQGLVRGLSGSLDAAFQALLRPEVPWTQREHVDDKSPWVDLLASGLESVAVLVRHHVENKRYVRAWCDKAVTLVTTRLLQAIVRLRPVRARAAAQWLADVQHVRTILQELPHFDAPGRAWDSAGGASQTMQASYARLVDRSMAKIEPLLRVLAGPEEPSAMVAAYREHVQDQALPTFQKLLDLRGLRRPDQTPWVEAFLAAIDRAPDALPTTSALSSLQLDPNADVYALPELGERRDESHDTMSPNRPSTPSGATALSLPDWKKFGSMFGVALGQRRP